MELTSKQKIEILKRARKEISNGRTFLCTTIGWLLKEKHGIDIPHCNQEGIRKIFPKFKQETAHKYFGAYRFSYAWWDLDQKEKRIKFLTYMITNKLPVKPRSKK